MASNKSAAAAEEHYGDSPLISRLSIQPPDDGEDADDEKSWKASPSAADDEDDDDGDVEQGTLEEQRNERVASQHRQRQLLRLTWGPLRECASGRRLWARNRRVERTWEARRCRSGGEDSGECMVVVRPGGGSGRKICMDMDEVRACRDLGLEIPRDFTVEIPGGLSGNSSGGDSPISGPGEEPKEIKAKLKMWAHAVAFVSAASRSDR